MDTLALPGSSQFLLMEKGFTEKDIERRKKIVGLEQDDVARVVAIREVVQSHIDFYVRAFFEHLASLEEAQPLFASRSVLEKARSLKAEHMAEMMQGQYGLQYVEQRLELGALYASVGLDTRVFLGAYQVLLKQIGATIIRHFANAPEEGLAHLASMQKVAFFDIGIIIDIMVPEREHVIRKQQQAIRELSTPVLHVGTDLLLLPVIGALDSGRAHLLIENLLDAIRSKRAKVAVMDVTGVATIDTQVANYFLQAVEAARIMGVHIIVTGLSSEVAQSLVIMGVDLSKMNTMGDLRAGLDAASGMIAGRSATRLK